MIEIVDDDFDLVVMPYIVLIGEENDVAFAEIDCFLEIGADTEVRFVTMDADGDGGLFAEAFDDGQGMVGAAVIADHDLIHRQGLVENGFNLLADILFAVICAECDGDHGWLSMEDADCPIVLTKEREEEQGKGGAEQALVYLRQMLVPVTGMYFVIIVYERVFLPVDDDVSFFVFVEDVVERRAVACILAFWEEECAVKVVFPECEAERQLIASAIIINAIPPESVHFTYRVVMMSAEEYIGFK